MRLAVIFVVLQVLVGSVAVCADALTEDPMAFCPPTSTAAKVDGVLDELFWQVPAEISEFVSASGKAASEGTQAWIAFGTTDGVYFAFECEQAKMSPANSPTNKEIWTDDSVEVFIDADGDRGTYDHFILSAAGARLQERGSGQDVLRDAAAKFQGTVKLADGRWTAEIFVPYSTIGAKWADGAVLRANLCRNNAVTGESSSWVTASGNFHQPIAFGNLLMGVPMANVKLTAAAGERLSAGSAKIRVSCDNKSKVDAKIVPTLFPGGRALTTEKPMVVQAGKTAEFTVPVELSSLERIDLRLAAVDAHTGAAISESSFGANVMPPAPKPVGGIVATGSWGSLWQCVSTFKVMRDTKPPANKKQAVEISAARNEYEPFQLVLRPARAVSGVKVVPHTLTGPNGAKLEAWNISVRNVEYVNVTIPTSADVTTGEYPDPLPDFQPTTASAGVNTPVWITVNVPPKAKPGVYTGTIDITGTGIGKLVVPLKVRVRDFELPQVSTLRTAYGCSIGNAAKYQGATTLEQKRKLLELYNLDFYRHRVSTYRPYAYYDIKGAVQDGKITLDFSDFDAAIQKFFPWFNSFVLPGFGMGDTAGMNFGDNYDQLKVEYMRMVTEHLVDKGQIAKGYNYITDEPTEEQYKACVEAAELCRMADQRIKVLLTEQVENPLIGSVDIWCPVLPAYDEVKSKERQKAGEEVWWYVCCGPHHPYPNNFIDYPAIDHRILSWITWRYGVNGILYWDTAYWRDNPWETPMSYTPDGKHKWGNGDGHLLYPATRKPSDKFVAKGPVDSIRWEMIREGVEDYDYFRILSDRVKKNAGKKTPALQKAQDALKLIDSCAKSRTEYATDPARLEAVRAKVADAIEGLK